VNFNFQPPAIFALFFFAKALPLKVAQPLKIYQHATFHRPTFTGASFASILETERQPFCNG
jgi:hypothetical protein